MTRRICLAVLALVAIAALGLLGFSTFRHQGEDAIQRMDETDLEYLSKVRSLRPGMSLPEVELAMGGPPDRKGSRPTWRVAVSGRNQIAVYMSGNELRKVRWMKIGSFVYEHP